MRFRRENSSEAMPTILLRASGMDVISFHGFGNEIAAPGQQRILSNDPGRVRHPSLAGVLPWVERTTLRVGPLLRVLLHRQTPGPFPCARSATSTAAANSVRSVVRRPAPRQPGSPQLPQPGGFSWNWAATFIPPSGTWTAPWRGPRRGSDLSHGPCATRPHARSAGRRQEALGAVIPSSSLRSSAAPPPCGWAK